MIHRLAVLVLALSALTAVPALAAKNGKNDKDAEINAALTAMAAGSNTIGGPGYYQAGDDGNRDVYRVVGGAAPDACITVRNLGPGGRLKIVADGTPVPGSGGRNDDEIRPGLTVTRCLASPSEIKLRCDGSCRAVWRIDAN